MRRFAQIPCLRKATAAAAAALLTLTLTPFGVGEATAQAQFFTIGDTLARSDSTVNNAGTYLMINSPQGASYVCSGTLITEVHVLTAKHCVHDTNTDEQILESATATIGLNRTAPTDTGTVSTDGVAIHPTADLAVLTLDRPVDNTTPAPVLAKEIDDNGYAVASGFGTGDGNMPLEHMGEASIRLRGKQEFRLDGMADTTQVGYFGTPTGNDRITQGDSGGPLHDYNQVIGVNAGVERDFPFTMTFVPTQDYAEWIESVAPGSVEGLPEAAPAPAPALSGPSIPDSIPALVASVQTRVSDLLGID